MEKADTRSSPSSMLSFVCQGHKHPGQKTPVLLEARPERARPPSASELLHPFHTDTVTRLLKRTTCEFTQYNAIPNRHAPSPGSSTADAHVYTLALSSYTPTRTHTGVCPGHMVSAEPEVVKSY